MACVSAFPCFSHFSRTLFADFTDIVLGCVYNIKTKGMSGVQACPQYEFWSDIPSLVKDGCSFTMSKIRGEGGSKQTYDEL